MNNLLIEFKRRQLQQEFMELSEPDINSPQENSNNLPKAFRTRLDPVDSLRGNDIELQDTEDPEIKQGIKSNGVKYSVRTNRKRFFFPDEWIKFKKSFETIPQKRSFDILINTGGRTNG